MANAIIRFSFDATGMQRVREDLAKIVEKSRAVRLRMALVRAKKRERRAYLNMLRSTRRNRAEMVRKWHLARLHVRACEMRIEKPNATIRIVSRCVRREEPVVFIDIEAERVLPLRMETIRGHRLSVAEIDEVPV